MAGDPSAGIKINPLKPYIILSFKSGELIISTFLFVSFKANYCTARVFIIQKSYLYLICPLKNIP